MKRLVKKYLAFCGSLSGEGASAEEVEKHKESFLKELALYEFQLGRTAAVTAANEREMASYAEARGEVDDAVARAEADIRALRDALDAARLDRRHKEEYETLRGCACSFRRGRHRGGVRARSEREIAHLEAQSDAASRALNLRKKQFALLLHAANELRRRARGGREDGGGGTGGGRDGDVICKNQSTAYPTRVTRSRGFASSTSIGRVLFPCRAHSSTHVSA